MFHNINTMEEQLQLVFKYLDALHLVFSLSGCIWENLEGLPWLFRVVELFSQDFLTVLHFADVP